MGAPWDTSVATGGWLRATCCDFSAALRVDPAGAASSPVLSAGACYGEKNNAWNCMHCALERLVCESRVWSQPNVAVYMIVLFCKMAALHCMPTQCSKDSNASTEQKVG